MEQIDSSPACSVSRKRAAGDEPASPQKRPLNLTGSQFVFPSPPDTDHSSNASPTYENHSMQRQASPAPSLSTLSSVDVPSPGPGLGSDTAAPTPLDTDKSGPPPAKRRKLTPAEKEQQQKDKEQQQKEKEAKAAERAEQKAIKDEEKRVKDEEKRRRAEEKDAKRREKEVEEQRKTEAKMKKERSQMRLGVFFQKPPATPGESPGDTAFPLARRKSLSLEPFDAMADRQRLSESPCKGEVRPGPTPAAAAVAEVETPAKPQVSDYRKYFLPFQLRTYSSLARDERTAEQIGLLQDAFDLDLRDPSLREKFDLGIVDSYASLPRLFAAEGSWTRGAAQHGIRKLVDQIQGSSSQPIDLTDDTTVGDPMNAMHAIARRHIQFEEDVRPAYSGTYTKIRSPRVCSKIKRNPFVRARKDTDYDYDSEAEWQEEEEGEDLIDEDDDEAESIGEADEMDGFLDDEDDALRSKRKMITGDLVPSSSGLCWENEAGRALSTSGGPDPTQDLRDMRIGFLLPGFSGKTIDPFSTAYWQIEPPPAAANVTAPIRESPFAPPCPPMAPPRAPLQPRPNTNGPIGSGLIGAAEGMKGPITSVAVQEKKGKLGRPVLPKTLSSEDMEEFKEAVVGSPLGKADLLKGLKSRFPKITHEAIKSTLGEHFAQMGATKADKKWVFIPRG